MVLTLILDDYLFFSFWESPIWVPPFCKLMVPFLNFLLQVLRKNDERVQCLLGLVLLVSAILHNQEYVSYSQLHIIYFYWFIYFPTSSKGWCTVVFRICSIILLKLLLQRQLPSLLLWHSNLIRHKCHNHPLINTYSKA